MRVTTGWILAIACLAPPARGQAPAKAPLDHLAYDQWRTIEDEALSADGRWLVYRLVPQQGDASLTVRDVLGDRTIEAARGLGPRFTDDTGFLVFRIAPEYAAMRAAKHAKKKRDEMPRDSLGVLDLATGAVLRAADVKSFAVPEDGPPIVAYLSALPDSAADAAAPPPDSAGADSAARPKARTAEQIGTPLVLRRFPDGVEFRFPFVTEYVFAKDGRRLAYVASTRDGAGDGVYLVDVAVGVARAIASGRGTYQSLAFDEAGEQLTFLATRGDPDAKPPAFGLFHWRAGEESARVTAEAGTPGVPAGWTVSRHEAPSFSRDGRRVLFGTMPRPAPEVEDTLLDEDRIALDVWHWEDPDLQPMQLRRVKQDQERSYRAMVDLRADRVVQLATEAVPEVTIGARGNAAVAVATADRAYRKLSSWETPGFRDVYLVDVATGARRPLLTRTRSNVSLSPEAKYAVWYDYDARAWFAAETEGGAPVNVTRDIPHALYDEEHDSPSEPSPYGVAGWTTGDGALLVYDRHDIWVVDPSGRRPARSVTEGKGRAEGLRFRVVRVDREEDAIDPATPMLLAAFDYRTKTAGFSRDRVNGAGPPERLVMMERRFSQPVKAERADRLLWSRESVAEFPDLWVSGLGMEEPRRVTDANPQQAGYRWATVELIEWTSADGSPLQGLLYKPDDFDPSRKYPLLVNFYERDSDNLYAHHPPIPHRSVIRPTFYASRGYLVFMPDVRYRVGYPGQSALDAVVPGVLRLIQQGFVDEARIGVQGHSWGGYQIAYLVTRTNLFRAAAAGAPVANMTSAYGGIRWESGMSRMFQYERTQSRIGATLWEAPMRYIDNSPLFALDRVETPLLILHNDNDGAVPWYQGIELFVGLRRLGKPAWLVNYNGEPHWPSSTYAKRRDWNIRLQQFFDHYLLGAPAPVWLAEGIPAVEKGKTLGLDLVTESREGVATNGGR
jgi:dipeptidyl aminopeptidase/acylaminoacyl peptidase